MQCCYFFFALLVYLSIITVACCMQFNKDKDIFGSGGVENFYNDAVLNLSFRVLIGGQSVRMEEQDSSACAVGQSRN